MDKKWYMITTISGKEEKVIESLKNRVVSERVLDSFNSENGKPLDEDFKVFLIPHIAPKELAKKQAGEDFDVKTRNLYKGYIFVKMDMTNNAWFVVRNTQYVTGLVGSSGQRAKPTPVSNLEIRKMEKRVAKIKEDFDKGIVKSQFEPGSLVTVIDGSAKGQVGTIIESNDEKEMALVELFLFGRKTPTSISYKDLELKK